MLGFRVRVRLGLGLIRLGFRLGLGNQYFCPSGSGRKDMCM